MADVALRTWSAAEYHASDAISRSRLVDFEGSPALFRDVHIARTRPAPEPSRAMEIGTLLHLAVLEPAEWQTYREQLRGRLVDKPEFAGKGARARELDWRADLPSGAIVCTAKQRADREADVHLVEEMASAILQPRTPAGRVARSIVERSVREVTYTWRDTDPELAAGPMECRARLDLVSITLDQAHIVDLKTCADPSPEAFSRSVANFNYHWQPPFYSAPVLEATGLVPRFGFIAVRNAPPFEVVVYKVRPEDITAADVQVRRAMRRLSECIATNNWTAPWETEAQTLHVPRWALDRTA